MRLRALSESPAAFGARFDDEGARPVRWFADRLETSVVVGAGSGAGALLGVGGYRAAQSAYSQHVGELWGFYVEPEARRKGIGAAILKSLIGEAEGALESLRLTVAASNAAAIGLYRSAGFIAFGREPKAMRLGDRYDDEILMRRPLAAEAADSSAAP